MTNIYAIVQLVEFLEHHGINTRQLTYCLLLYYDKKYSRIEGTNKINRPLSQLYKYFENIEKFPKTELEELVEKGFIEQTSPDFKIDHVEVTPKFEKSYFGNKYKLDQLIEAYPKFVDNFEHPSKPKIPLVSISNFSELERLYARIANAKATHEMIIDLTTWGRENNQIKMSIEKYINSRFWETLAVLREETENPEMSNMHSI